MCRRRLADRLIVAALALVFAVALAACARPQIFHQEAYVFGTRVDLTVYGGAERDAAAAMAAVLQEFDRLHQAWHAWQPSELTALNQAIAAGEAATVSTELASVLADAQRLAALGDGLFNPAMGKLIELWGFHSDTFVPRLPDPQALQAVIDAKPRMSDLVIDGTRVASRNPSVQLDLGGYAKGYALDRAAAILKEKGIDNALINIGGNVLALGAKGDMPWRIGLQHPREPRPLATLPLYEGEAIGTSGDYQRYFEINGYRYSHLIDPRTGAPAHDSQSLTVLVTPREHAGTISDVASKPAFIAGDAWREYTGRYDIDHALRVTAQGQIEVTRELRARLEFPSDPPPITVVD